MEYVTKWMVSRVDGNKEVIVSFNTREELEDYSEKLKKKHKGVELYYFKQIVPKESKDE